MIKPVSKTNSIHIGVLDGIRAMAICIVVWFHFWQQSWLAPVFDFPFLASVGIKPIDLNWLVRTGYEMVDLLILLSGFCLFLPYARSMVTGLPVSDTKTFFKKRVARIVPSYLFCILVLLFVFALPQKVFYTPSIMWKDILTHLTFTHNLFKETYFDTHLNGVLWTVAVEVQFYLIFPLVSKLFRKNPIITYLAMIIGSLLFKEYILRYQPDNLRFFVNQLPTFFGVYANGMMGALLYVHLKDKFNKKPYLSYIASLVALTCPFWYHRIMNSLLTFEINEIGQLTYRLPLSFVFITFILCLAFSVKPLQKLFSNRIMRFISAISFNLYIWHQFISVKCKELKIPFWEGDTPPNQTGDTVWIWKYFIIISLTSLAIATAMTYLLEKPAAKLLLRTKNKLRSTNKGDK